MSGKSNLNHIGKRIRWDFAESLHFEELMNWKWDSKAPRAAFGIPPRENRNGHYCNSKFSPRFVELFLIEKNFWIFSKTCPNKNNFIHLLQLRVVFDPFCIGWTKRSGSWKKRLVQPMNVQTVQASANNVKPMKFPNTAE